MFIYLDTTSCKSAKAKIFEELKKCLVVEIVCKILSNNNDNANENLRSILGLMCIILQFQQRKIVHILHFSKWICLQFTCAFHG